MTTPTEPPFGLVDVRPILVAAAANKSLPMLRELRAACITLLGVCKPESASPLAGRILELTLEIEARTAAAVPGRSGGPPGYALVKELDS